jgi:hypothetical protein
VLSEFSFLSFALLFFAIFCIQIIVVFRYIIRFEFAYDLTLSSPGMTLYGMLLDVIESSKNIEQNILS